MMVVIAALLPVVVAAPAAARPPTRPPPPSGLAGWTLAGTTQQPTTTAGQGLATVATKRKTTIVYRGDSSIPWRLRLAGWDHIGDPDAWGGYVFDAYQSSTTGSKLFEVTTPTGERYDFTHHLDAAAGEAMNNSFAAISPDGQWLVSGEWGAMQRLLVFPTPLLNVAARDPAADLPLVGTISLSASVSYVQGCDFLGDGRLLCTSDGVFSGVVKPLLEIDLGGLSPPLPPSAVTPIAVGPLPLQSTCTGTFEAEGIDAAANGDLRVEVIPPSPCATQTTIYRYQPA